MSESKADLIRRYLKDAGSDPSPTDIAKQINDDHFGGDFKTGVKVAHVSNEKRKTQRGKNRVDENDLPASLLKKVKALADEIGSVAILRMALDELEKLQTSAFQDSE